MTHLIGVMLVGWKSSRIESCVPRIQSVNSAHQSSKFGFRTER